MARGVEVDLSEGAGVTCGVGAWLSDGVDDAEPEGEGTTWWRRTTTTGGADGTLTAPPVGSGALVSGPDDGVASVGGDEAAMPVISPTVAEAATPRVATRDTRARCSRRVRRRPPAVPSVVIVVSLVLVLPVVIVTVIVLVLPVVVIVVVIVVVLMVAELVHARAGGRLVAGARHCGRRRPLRDLVGG